MKSLFSSKTFWFNVVGLLAGLATVFGIDVSPEMQAQLVTVILFVVTLGDIGLRTVTNKGVYIVKHD